ncbi:hypothetical protein B0H12DRAFT_1230841 [Mycena haematopus]|nr:hypothetical protein B0H12DRAFT_1230841 [Mycena haematopus]
MSRGPGWPFFNCVRTRSTPRCQGVQLHFPALLPPHRVPSTLGALHPDQPPCAASSPAPYTPCSNRFSRAASQIDPRKAVSPPAPCVFRPRLLCPTRSPQAMSHDAPCALCTYPLHVLHPRPLLA